MAHQLVSDMSSGTEQTCNAGGKSHENKALYYVLSQSLVCMINVETRYGVICYIHFIDNKLWKALSSEAT